MTRRLRLAALAAALALLAAGAALAYINPGFTPMNLVEKAEYILQVSAGPGGTDEKVVFNVVRVFKGKDKAPKGPLTVDLTVTARDEDAAAFRDLVKAAGSEPILFFTGKVERKEGGALEEASLVHLAGRWYALDKAKAADAFEFEKRDGEMEGIWAGGTDMLAGITDLLVRYPDTDVPVKAGVSWAAHTRLERLEGRVRDMRAPDLDGQGGLRLHLACESGDRLWGFDRKDGKPVDETARRKLAARSQAAAWADFDGDGRLDLVSWDGQALSVFPQQADGSFGAPKKVEAAPAGKCLGLAVLDSATPGRPALLWSGEKGPALLSPGKDGAWSAAALDLGKADLAALGEPGRCLVGDLDDDGLADALFPLTGGSLLFRGRALGALGPGEKTGLLIGKAPGSAFLGDFDMDGRLDVFCVAEDGCRLWHNRAGKAPGELGFEQSVHISGEVAYISKPGGLWGNTCDVNNDGRQDVFFVYGEVPQQGPHIFFNRGFRSFGHAHDIDVTERTLLERLETKGQQHGIVADFTGDGAQDMAVVLKGGELCFFPRAPGKQTPLCARAHLPIGGATVGPVKVTGWNERRCLGAWNVTAGSEEGFFGQSMTGPVRLKWRLPGAKETRAAEPTLSDETPVVRVNLATGT